MPPNKRYAGTLNCHVPDSVRQGIMEIARKEGKNQSEAMRTLLELGLQAKGVDCL